jgi:hypothetical protein
MPSNHRRSILEFISGTYDPLADHTDAIIDATEAQDDVFSGGGSLTIEFPADVFNYDRGVDHETSRFFWKGPVVGAGSSRGGSVLRKQSTQGKKNTFVFSGLNGLVVRGLRFESPNILASDDTSLYEERSAAIENNSNTHFLFEDIHVDRSAGGAILSQNSQYGTLLKCHAYAVLKDAFHITGGSAAGGYAGHITRAYCTSVMADDDAFPVVGYSSAQIIEDITDICCRVYGQKRARAFMISGCDGYRSFGCSVLARPADFPSASTDASPTNYPLGAPSALLFLSDTWFPVHGVRNARVHGFYADTAGSSDYAAIQVAHSGAGSGHEDIYIEATVKNSQNRVVTTNGNTSKIKNIRLVGDFDGGNVFGLNMAAGTDVSINARVANVAQHAAIFFNGIAGHWDVKLRSKDVQAGGSGGDIVTIGDTSGNFDATLNLHLKVESQTEAVDRTVDVGASVPSNALNILVEGPALATGDSVNYVGGNGTALPGASTSVLTSNAGEFPYIIQSPYVYPPSRTVAHPGAVSMAIGGATSTGSRQLGLPAGQSFRPTDVGCEVRINDSAYAWITSYVSPEKVVANVIVVPTGVPAGINCTISNASPAVFTFGTPHGKVPGDPVSFTSSGSLPTGLSGNEVYFVSATGHSASSFRVSSLPGGTLINTSSAGSGTHLMRGVVAAADWVIRRSERALQPGAVDVTSTTATAALPAFTAADVGKRLLSLEAAGGARITAVTSPTEATITELSAFTQTNLPASTWYIADHWSAPPLDPQLMFWRTAHVDSGTVTKIEVGPHPDTPGARKGWRDTGITRGFVVLAPGEAVRVTYSSVSGLTISSRLSYVSPGEIASTL